MTLMLTACQPDTAHTALKLRHGNVAAGALHPVAPTQTCGPVSWSSAALRHSEQALPQPPQQVRHHILVIVTLSMYSNTIDTLVHVNKITERDGFLT